MQDAYLAWRARFNRTVDLTYISIKSRLRLFSNAKNTAMPCLDHSSPGSNMTQSKIVLYAFGDQTYDTTGLLSTLLLGDNALVLNFVEQVTRRLRQEVAALEPEQRAQCPRFASLLDLIPHWKSNTLHPALCQALTCLAQIGAFLASHGYEQGSKPFPTASTSCLTGVCTGLLSAAAVSHSTNIGQLLLLGEESVVAAFRVGALAANVASRVTCGRDSGGSYMSWTAALVGIDVDAMVKQVDGLEVSKKSSSKNDNAVHRFADNYVSETRLVDPIHLRSRRREPCQHLGSTTRLAGIPVKIARRVFHSYFANSSSVPCASSLFGKRR